MDSDRYQRIKSIVFEASDLSPDEQAAFVADACGDDAALRREVERFLSDEPDTADLQAPIAAATKESTEAPMPARAEPSIERTAWPWLGWGLVGCLAVALLALGMWALVDALRFDVPAVTGALGVDEREASVTDETKGRKRGVSGVARVLNDRAAALLAADRVDHAEVVTIQSLLAAHAQKLLATPVAPAALDIPELPELKEDESNEARAARVFAHIDAALEKVLPADDPARIAVRRERARLAGAAPSESLPRERD